MNGRNGACAVFDTIRVQDGKSVNEEMLVFNQDLLCLAKRDNFDKILDAEAFESLFMSILPICVTCRALPHENGRFKMKDPTNIMQNATIPDFDSDDEIGE